jgi:hypothetical protein
MQHTIKRLIIIVLSVFLISFFKTGTAFAYPEYYPGHAVAKASFYKNAFRFISPRMVNNNRFSEDGKSDSGTPVAQNTAVPLTNVITSTPDEDGIIIHEVKYGETLFTIAQAYGVPIDQILSNSGLSLSTTEIREGQTLVIQTASEPTATPSTTATIDPGTPTPTQVRPTRTPFPTRTPAPTHTPTRPPSLIHRALGDAKSVGIGLVFICGSGLLIVVYLGFLKKS